MCIHPLAMADGLSAVPDYLPGRHRGERPRSWSSSPLLIVIPALDRHPRESGDLASLIPTASRHRVPTFAGMTAIIRNCFGTAAESERKHARSCTFPVLVFTSKGSNSKLPPPTFRSQAPGPQQAIGLGDRHSIH